LYFALFARGVQPLSHGIFVSKKKKKMPAECSNRQCFKEAREGEGEGAKGYWPQFITLKVRETLAE